MRLILSFAALFLSVILLQLSSGGVGPLDALTGLEQGFTKGQIGILGSSAGASPLIVGSSVAVINLRHMLYSAAVAKYLRPLSLRWRIILGYLLTDEAFAISIKRFETTDRPELAHHHLLGSGLTLWVCWQIATVVGVLDGATIPDELNLGFAIPLTFMAVVLPNLRRLSDIAAATSAALVALFGQALPWNAWIVAAAVVGITVGGILSHWEDRA